jgi:small subunit ribosomal protein S7
MSRKKKKDYTRQIESDSKYKSQKISKFINRIMQNGKKRTAERIVYSALEKLEKETSQNALDSFELALKNTIPLMEVKSRRVGGSTYQVPMEVAPKRGLTLAMRWIIANARSRSGRSMFEKLASELTDAFNNVGSSIKKREDTHKMAAANKAFAHFRW